MKTPTTLPEAVDSTASFGTWQPIQTLDRTQMQFVLVTEDGAVRLHLWNPRGYWERAFPIGSIVDNGDCENPTHWMPLPGAIDAGDFQTMD